MKSTIFPAIILSCSLIGPRLSLRAQPIFLPKPVVQRQHMPAVFSTGNIIIDGRADEVAWASAGVVTHFTEAYPRQGGKATFDTEVRLLYDKENLYISARCHFPPGKKLMQVQDMRRDFGFSDNELFEVLIDPFKDPRLPVMAFCVTPYGTQMDIMHYVDGTYDYKWDALWQAASTVGPDVWSTELAIPFSSLRYPRDSTEWSINFVRNIRYLGELNGWSPWPMNFNESHLEYGGILTGIRPPAPQTSFRIEPYALVNSNSTDGHATRYKPEAGGEIKYAVNTNTLLEGTFNTDFAQADIDKEVINLTRSHTFFPEKRQFFLENASLFSVGQNNFIQPFFSRSIGLSAAGNPIPIKAGLRLIHQNSRHSLGLLLMQQGGDTTETGAFFGVLRYKKNLSSHFQLGGMAILRENQAGFQRPAYANSVGVVDAFWKPYQSFFIRGMASVSDNTLTRKKGWAAFSEVSYVDNIIFFDWFETAATSGYQAQTGYLERTDFVHSQPTLALYLTRNWFPKKLAFFSPQLSADIYHQASTGQFQEASLNLIPFQLIFTNLATFNVNMTSSWENLTNTFTPVRNISITAGQYHFYRYELYGLTNQGAPLSLETRLSTGGYYNGHMNSYYVSLRTAPIPHISLVLSYTHNDFKKVGEIDQQQTTHQQETTHLLAPELRLALNPRILLSAFYQYNTDTRNGSLNSRFSWEYRPLSFVYLVVNTVNNYYATPVSVPRQQISGILKLTYIRQL